MSLLALGASGCAGPETLSDDDRRAIAQLAEIAPRDSEIESDAERGASGVEVSEVECWKPSENGIGGTQFRVLCRVHYEEEGAERYRDVICVGDLADDPVSEYCYRWAYYSDMPAFEDEPGHVASG